MNWNISMLGLFCTQSWRTLKCQFTRTIRIRKKLLWPFTWNDQMILLNECPVNGYNGELQYFFCTIFGSGCKMLLGLEIPQQSNTIFWDHRRYYKFSIHNMAVIWFTESNIFQEFLLARNCWPWLGSLLKNIPAVL